MSEDTLDHLDAVKAAMLRIRIGIECALESNK